MDPNKKVEVEPRRHLPRTAPPVREGRPNPSGLPSLSRPPVRPFIVAPKLVAPPAGIGSSDPSDINANKFGISAASNTAWQRAGIPGATVATNSGQGLDPARIPRANSP